MVTAALETRQMSLEEYIRLSYEEGPFEWVDGERIDIMPPLAGHSHISHLIFRLLEAYPNLGVPLMETHFALVEKSNWVKGARVPDVMFYTAERLAQYRQEHPDWREKPYLIAPDLAVEIVSKHDRFAEIDEKVADYLRDGVRLIWVIDAHRHKVVVYSGQQQQRLSEQDALSGGDVIPGFSVPVASLFE